ncbi:hypothetical protein MMC28_004561 [Mycoblastus sanguinarius]|nr:hypothetical protein [Mycoblastus sanguinarius]
MAETSINPTAKNNTQGSTCRTPSQWDRLESAPGKAVAENVINREISTSRTTTDLKPPTAKHVPRLGVSVDLGFKKTMPDKTEVEVSGIDAKDLSSAPCQSISASALDRLAWVLANDIPEIRRPSSHGTETGQQRSPNWSSTPSFSATSLSTTPTTKGTATADVLLPSAEVERQRFDERKKAGYVQRPFASSAYAEGEVAIRPMIAHPRLCFGKGPNKESKKLATFGAPSSAISSPRGKTVPAMPAKLPDIQLSSSYSPCSFDFLEETEESISDLLSKIDGQERTDEIRMDDSRPSVDESSDIAGKRHRLMLTTQGCNSNLRGSRLDPHKIGVNEQPVLTSLDEAHPSSLGFTPGASLEMVEAAGPPEFRPKRKRYKTKKTRVPAGKAQLVQRAISRETLNLLSRDDTRKSHFAPSMLSQSSPAVLSEDGDHTLAGEGILGKSTDGELKEDGGTLKRDEATPPPSQCGSSAVSNTNAVPAPNLRNGKSGSNTEGIYMASNHVLTLLQSSINGIRDQTTRGQYKTAGKLRAGQVSVSDFQSQIGNENDELPAQKAVRDEKSATTSREIVQAQVVNSHGPGLLPDENKVEKCNKPANKKTWRPYILDTGEIVSKSKFVRLKRRAKAKEREEQVLAAGDEFDAEASSSINNLSDRSSQLSNININHNHNLSPKTSQDIADTTTSKAEQALQLDNMTTKGAGRGSQVGRGESVISWRLVKTNKQTLTTCTGRIQGRNATNQIPDDKVSAFMVQRARSTSRRPRGFQPSEVGKIKSIYGDDGAPPHDMPASETRSVTNAQASGHLPDSAGAPALIKSSTSTKALAPYCQDQFSSTDFITFAPKPAVQNVILDASRPELDPVEVGSASRPDQTENSSVRIIVDGTKPSFWSKLNPSELSQPNWANKTAFPNTFPATSPYVPRAAEMNKLPKYRFPTPRNKQVDPIAQSFGRQLANMPQKQTEIVAEMRNPVPNMVIHQTATKESKVAVHMISSLDSHGNHESTVITNDEASNKVPPHFTAQAPCPEPRASNKEEHATPPHLRASKTQGTNVPAHNEEIEGANRKIAAMQNNEVPTHFRGHAAQKPLEDTNNGFISPLSAPQTEDIVRPTIDIDEEEATAQQSTINVDEEIAINLRAESVGEHPVAQPQATMVCDNKQLKSVRPHLRGPSAEALTRRPGSTASATLVPDLTAKGTTGHATVRPELTTLTDATDTRQSNQNMKTPSSGGIYHNQSSFISPSRSSAFKKGKMPETQGIDVDWEGKIAPPPLGNDWNQRAHYDPRSQERLSAIEAWREELAADPEAKSVKVDLENNGFQTGNGLAGDDRHVINSVNEADHEAIPNKDKFTQARRNQSAADAIKAFEARRAAEGTPKKSYIEGLTKEERREYRRLLIEEERTRVITRSPYAPSANVYLRPAELQDMRQVMEIYNYYVSETSVAPELDPTDEIYWRDRWQEADDDKNPFIVAINMGQKPMHGCRNIQRNKEETIVGFAVTSDYGVKQSVFLYTVELEMFVRVGNFREGIGRTMLDRMLAALDPGYTILECAPFLCDYQPFRWVGGDFRVAKSILVNVIHREGCENNLSWQKKWLNKNDFKHVGTLPKIGFKFGKP